MIPKLFDCECGGAVRLVGAPGRVREYRRGCPLPVPDDFVVPTCDRCNDLHLTADEAKELDKIQEPMYAAWQRGHVGGLIATLRSKHNVSIRDIERACGVTGTYLSHVLAGRKEAGTPLLRLLEAYANHADEFLRHLRPGEAVPTGPTPEQSEAMLIAYKASQPVPGNVSVACQEPKAPGRKAKPSKKPDLAVLSHSRAQYEQPYVELPEGPPHGVAA